MDYLQYLAAFGKAQQLVPNLHLDELNHVDAVLVIKNAEKSLDISMPQQMTAVHAPRKASLADWIRFRKLVADDGREMELEIIAGHDPDASDDLCWRGCPNVPRYLLAMAQDMPDVHLN
ncbi:hypothetical protein E4U60_003903 [Claviceps pazoutovae]|uniref:Uncharacterized protein n=1 Tax=Claviceps pazoutovae TaxID=1649127 RepID=A0A9P7M9W2_9HYPO|nr:hypothetical protein E4U60_003903 [Claviceps pazoutovae]